VQVSGTGAQQPVVPLARRLRNPLAVAAASVGAAAVLLVADAADQRIVPPCPFLTVTGHWCPLCGGTRCVEAILHGDLAAAAGYNILVLLLAPVVAVGLLWWAVGAAAGRHDGSFPDVDTRLLRAVVLVFLLFGLIRNIPGAESLAP
jgi:hypothetical protein